MSNQSDRIPTLVGDMNVKVPVLCAATTNIVLSGEQTIDGFTTNNSRVLLTAQTSSDNNGIYLSDTGTWIRDADCDGPQQMTEGTLIYAVNGTTNKGFWYCTTTTSPIECDGSMAINFGQASSVLALVSVYMQSILGETSAAALLTAQGFSAFFQTLISAVNAAAINADLGLGTAALVNTGTTAGTVPLLTTGGALPAISGANLTGLPSLKATFVNQFYPSN